MKISDIVLIICLLIGVGLLSIFLKKEESLSSVAKVYYENELKLTIDLSINKEYDVMGYNGNVHIVVKDKKIKVEEENSPRHLCSKQGFISSSNQVIVCLPNKIIIQIEDENVVDTVIG